MAKNGSLTIKERLQLLEILPAQGDVTTLRIVRSLREELSFSEDEHKTIGFRQEGNQILWNQDSSLIKDVPMGAKAKEVISTSLKKLNEEKQLPMDYLDLYERFVEE